MSSNDYWKSGLQTLSSLMQICALKPVSWRRSHLPCSGFGSCFIWPLMTMDTSHSEMFQDNGQLSVLKLCWNPPSSIQGSSQLLIQQPGLCLTASLWKHLLGKGESHGNEEGFFESQVASKAITVDLYFSFRNDLMEPMVPHKSEMTKCILNSHDQETAMFVSNQTFKKHRSQKVLSV